MWGKEENGRQFPQPFWKTPFDHLKHKVSGPTTSLLPRGSCSSFFVSITQHPGPPKPLPGGTKAQTTLQCLVRGRFKTSHVDHPSLTAPHSLTSYAGHVRGGQNHSEDVFDTSTQDCRITDNSTRWVMLQNTATEIL